MPTTVVTGDSVFEQILGGINYGKDATAWKVYPYLVRVACIKRRPPRHEFFEYLLNIGMIDIPRILKFQPIDKEVLSFVFPERWMNVAEQQSFMQAITKNPSVEKIKRVDLITSSPLIMTNFFREQIRIVTWPDDDEYEVEFP